MSGLHESHHQAGTGRERVRHGCCCHGHCCGGDDYHESSQEDTHGGHDCLCGHHDTHSCHDEHQHEKEHHHEAGCGCEHHHGHHHEHEVDEAPVFPSGASVLRIQEMDCPVEENDIRSILDGIEGVRSLTFNLVQRTLAVDAADAVVQQCVSAIQKGGYTVVRMAADSPAGIAAPEESTIRLWASLAIALFVEVIQLVFPDEGMFFTVGCMVLAVISILLAGLPTYRRGIASLFRLQLNVNALTAVAVTGAFVIGEWPEAAMVMSLYAISEWLERWSAVRANHAIRGLFELTPETAEMLAGNGWVDMAVKSIPVDAVIRIRPGQRVPLDGVVQDGHSMVDQSPVTGESIPVLKQSGDPVFAGTVNENGILQVRVISLADDTVVANIIKTVEDAQKARAPFQNFVDRFATIYTPLVFLVAVCVAIGMPLLAGVSWLEACYRSLAVLVISCPCALVISTPATIVSGLTAAARKGILIKGGIFLEQARKIGILAVDKTGTVTEGKPRLQSCRVVSERYPEQTVVDWGASLAGLSDHPVSRAIAMGVSHTEWLCRGFVDYAGKGVSASFDGVLLRLGKADWIAEDLRLDDSTQAQLRDDAAKGYTVTLLADQEGVLAVFAVADTVKSTSRTAVSSLGEMGVRTVMLTGDNRMTAESIAHEVGVSDFRANLLPEDKAMALSGLRHEGGGLVAMVGDGINDAPALATADLGIAMGEAGTDVAMEAADIVIMNDDLGNIPKLIRLSKDTFSILVQNITFALGIKVLFIVMALIGMATMWMAVFADIGTTLIVLFNGLRVLRK